MDIDKLIEAIRLCGSQPDVRQCRNCAYYAGGDMSRCIPRMTADAAAALSALRAQADREGRCVVLPAKTVFEITWDAGPDCDLACPVSVDTHGDCSFCDHGKQFVYERTCKQEYIDQIGKTVFLTREEAEKALGDGKE